MAMISNISWDLVEEILSRVPITCLGAVRTTCKPWNDLSKDGILCNTDAVQQFLGFMVKEYRICSMRFDLHGIVNEEGEEFVDPPSIKEIGNLFNQAEIFKIIYCEGLLLCITKEGDTRRLVIWNPYLGQTRWIQPLNNYHNKLDRYALGYDNKNRNYKILRFLGDHLPYVNQKRNHVFGYEIYDFSSDSWKVLDITPGWDIASSQRGVSLKGNTYFLAKEKTRIEEMVGPVELEVTHGFLLCFDFTRERFGQFLPLPFQHYSVFDTRTLSSLRDEKLVALYQCEDLSEVEIWVSTKIEPNPLFKT